MTALLEVPVDGGPYAVAAGPDGAMWVTLVHGGAVARVTNSGALSTFAVSPDSRPSLITAARDGALWFTMNQAGAIGRLDLNGRLTTREVPTPRSGPVGICAMAPRRSGKNLACAPLRCFK